MNVASLELCKELYELSGWDDTHWVWDKQLNVISEYPTGARFESPAYDLGYLLRKLERVEGGVSLTYCNHQDGSTNYCIYLNETLGGSFAYDDTPEDAAAKLAIELFKSGVLKKEIS